MPKRSRGVVDFVSRCTHNTCSVELSRAGAHDVGSPQQYHGIYEKTFEKQKKGDEGSLSRARAMRGIQLRNCQRHLSLQLINDGSNNSNEHAETTGTENNKWNALCGVQKMGTKGMPRGALEGEGAKKLNTTTKNEE